MSCTFTTDNGVEKSCIHMLEEDKNPILVVDERECAEKSFVATLEAIMCTEGGATIKLPKCTLSLGGDTVEGVTKVANGQCVTLSAEQEIDVCKQSTKMKAFLFAKKNIGGKVTQKSTRDIIVSHLVSPLRVDPCDPTDALITEIADPLNDSGARFVEITFDDCAGETIADDVVVVRHPDANSALELDLKNVTIPVNGVLVICANEDLSPGSRCDIVDDVGDNDGTEPVEIAKKPEVGDMETIDIYGAPGESNDPPFTDGKAVRKKSPDRVPQETFQEDEWEVFSVDLDNENGPIGPEGTDPGAWVNPIIISKITDPITGDESSSGHFAAVPRFIEMEVLEKDGFGEDNLKLALFHGSNSDPDFETAVSLKNLEVHSDSKILVCNDAANSAILTAVKNDITPHSCDIVFSDLFDGRLGDFGCDKAAIVLGDSTKYHIIDMYGNIGSGCDVSEFTTGKALRLDHATFPKPAYSPDDWEVITPTVPSPPTPAPVAPPSSKGKGHSSKKKRRVRQRS